jgi:hypothetical protein
MKLFLPKPQSIQAYEKCAGKAPSFITSSTNGVSFIFTFRPPYSQGSSTYGIGDHTGLKLFRMRTRRERCKNLCQDCKPCQFRVLKYNI